MVLASVIAGASGGALANVALSPLGGGAGMLQSYWYGAGLILGERDMYTFHWEKIKKRLESGEDYLSVLEGEMTPAITAIANFSLQIMEETSKIYLTAGVDMLAKLVENMLMLLAGEKVNEPALCPEGFKWDSVMQVCRPTTVEQPAPEPEPTPTITCPSGFRWSASAQQCVPEDIAEPGPTALPHEDPANAFMILDLPKYAIGHLFRTATGASLVVNNGYATPDDLPPVGKWVNLSQHLSIEDGISAGIASWPAPQYFMYKRTSDDYWFFPDKR